MLYQEAKIECLKNVDQYIKDIETLIDIESYGHAYALSVLAAEELAKGLSYSWGGPSDLKEDILKGITGGRNAHFHKIAHFTFVSKLAELSYLMKEEDMSPIESFLKVFINEISKSNYVENTTKEIKKINKKKMRGFYVDIEKKKIHSPTEFKKEDVMESLSTLKRNYELVIELLKFMEMEE